MGNPGQKLWLMEKTTPILLLPLKADRGCSRAGLFFCPCCSAKELFWARNLARDLVQHKLPGEAVGSRQAAARGIAEKKEKEKDGSAEGALETLQQISISRVINTEPCWDSLISFALAQSSEPKGWKG